VDADKLRDFGDLGIDGSAATGGGDAYGGSTNATDTQAASGIGLGNDIPDSGSAPIDQRIGGSSGCACSLSGPSRDTSLLVFAVAGILAVLVRRSRAR
jgi:MYXO-CTERM domain-containing protein